jgi:hypothetical protein
MQLIEQRCHAVECELGRGSDEWRRLATALCSEATERAGKS